MTKDFDKGILDYCCGIALAAAFTFIGIIPALCVATDYARDIERCSRMQLSYEDCDFINNWKFVTIPQEAKATLKEGGEI